MAVTVLFAVYGALIDGDPINPKVDEVTDALQQQLDDSDGKVTINNQTMGRDPAPGWKKHFGALIDVDGDRRAYACGEDQEIAILV